MTEGGPSILVVDDNEDNRYTLRQRLQREGYAAVVEAENGRRALDLLHERAFDLVLLDVMMPEMNGYEVLQAVKSDMALRDIPVIMISAVDEITSVVRCIELGAEDYLPKPFNPVLLRARIGACLEKKRLRDQQDSFLRSLQEERSRADSLLSAILPPSAARELKASNEVRPRRYADVSVLFCDIVDFTPYCERNPPEQVVAELQALFGRFEDLAQQHGIEKIKTIGDAFLAAGGLLRDVEDPVLACIRCGIEMAAAAKEQPPHWEVRVGIHHGPVVAGIIGKRQFLFDLWGDTVNIAARIVGKARPGTVVISHSGWMRAGMRCQARSQGFVELKGRGSMELVECSALL